jgi:hypothetical protein
MGCASDNEYWAKTGHALARFLWLGSMADRELEVVAFNS